MSFRRKFLLLLALSIVLAVGTVASAVFWIARRSLERVDNERATALSAQVEREFARRGDEITRKVEAIANSDQTLRMAVSLSRPGADPAVYVNAAAAVAEEQQLDFLEFVSADGKIISSAHWPARFGYSDPELSTPDVSKPFLNQEELPEGLALGMFAQRAVAVGDRPLRVIGGQRIDRDFLRTLVMPAGMRVLLYQNGGPEFSPAALVDADGPVAGADRVAALVQQAQRGADATTVVDWSSDAAHSETFRAVRLTGGQNQLLGLLLVGSSRRPLVELARHIGTVALLVTGSGILLAILLSGWAAARIARPVEQLAGAARQVAAGNWETQVAVTSSDELGELAQAFNQMTAELLAQRDRLVQSERVAAWRELARRLAHELKNPLFPLQITVENVVRARELSPQQFDEVFREATSTLLGEIANLKTIIGRFSDFSKMPKPELRPVAVNELVQGVARLFEAQLGNGTRRIECKVELDPEAASFNLDAELMHSALSNLVLNAMDAMPAGGTLTLRTQRRDRTLRLEISDTGAGMAPEERERLFTPYYTTKRHGTGLGLAIVQSVVSDHGGKVSVVSSPGGGTTFRIELPAGAVAMGVSAAAKSGS